MARLIDINYTSINGVAKSGRALLCFEKIVQTKTSGGSLEIEYSADFDGGLSYKNTTFGGVTNNSNPSNDIVTNGSISLIVTEINSISISSHARTIQIDDIDWIATKGDKIIASVRTTFSGGVVKVTNYTTTTSLNAIMTAYQNLIKGSIEGKIEQIVSAEISATTIGTHQLGVVIPNGAIVTKVFYDAIVAPNSSGGTGTLRFRIDSTNITAALAADNSVTGMADGSVDGDASNNIKLTADAELNYVIATTALSSGEVTIYVKYFLP